MRINKRNKRATTQKVKQIIRKKYSAADHTLNLDYCVDDWIQTLKYQDWKMVKQLLLRNCKITDANVSVFAQMQWPSLQIIRLYENQFTAKGIQKLLSNQTIKKLTDLCIGSNNIGCAGIKLIIKAELPLLKQLWLLNCQIGSQGGKYLSKGRWPHLEELSVACNKLDIQAYQYLSQYSNWKEIKSLWVQNNNNDAISLMPFVSSRVEKAEVTKTIGNKQLEDDIQKTLDERFILDEDQE